MEIGSSSFELRSIAVEEALVVVGKGCITGEVVDEFRTKRRAQRGIGIGIPIREELGLSLILVSLLIRLFLLQVHLPQLTVRDVM